MKTNKAGLELIKSLEGLRLKAYRLKGERYNTIGYGHHSSDIADNAEITKEQAEMLLKTDLAYFEKQVEKGLKKYGFKNYNANQFSAIVSYAYNRGANKIAALLKSGNSLNEIGNNFPAFWGTANTHKAALIERRKKEQALFFTPVSSGVANVGATGVSTGVATTAITVGKNYRLLENMNARYLPNGQLKHFSALSKSCQKQSTKKWNSSLGYYYGVTKRGTIVTVKEVRKIGTSTWVRTPSAWYCGIGSTGKKYIEEV